MTKVEMLEITKDIQEKVERTVLVMFMEQEAGDNIEKLRGNSEESMETGEAYEVAIFKDL